METPRAVSQEMNSWTWITLSVEKCAQESQRHHPRDPMKGGFDTIATRSY